jgi:hypothetical protein
MHKATENFVGSLVLPASTNSLISIKTVTPNAYRLPLRLLRLKLKSNDNVESGGAGKMAKYCLEIGNEDHDVAIIHRAMCHTYDHGSLLGLGRLVNLGDFDSPEQVLHYLQVTRPGAVECVDCCHAEMLLPSLIQRSIDANAVGCL